MILIQSIKKYKTNFNSENYMKRDHSRIFQHEPVGYKALLMEFYFTCKTNGICFLLHVSDVTECKEISNWEKA